MRFSCPGKIFIIGEYACIEGGPSLLGTLAPEFVLEIGHSKGRALPFAAESPAGLYLQTQRDILNEVSLVWQDPYKMPLGVGSSSAQFLLSVAAVSKLRDQSLPSVQELLELYWKTVGSSQGLRPSGADVLAQWVGGPVVVQNKPVSVKKLADLPKSAQFILAHTGHKAKTHEHLKTLADRGFPKAFAGLLDELNAITLSAIEAWKLGDTRSLGPSLNAFQSALADGGLAPAEFNSKLKSLQTWQGVLGCKGAGAQGGDCVLFLVENAHVSTVCEQIRALGWMPILPEWMKTGIQT